MSSIPFPNPSTSNRPRIATTSTTLIQDMEGTAEIVNQGYDLEVMISESRQKSDAEKAAWIALQKKLQPRSIDCTRCGGTGASTTAMGQSCDCKNCGGTGLTKVEADIEAVKMVLQPKFPKVSVNLNADIDNLSTRDLLDAIHNM